MDTSCSEAPSSRSRAGPAAGLRQQLDVLVIGAGQAGLAMAWHLARRRDLARSATIVHHWRNHVRPQTLRLSAGLSLGGLVTYVVVTALHTGGPANDHKVIFGGYAGSHDWAAVHLGQFVGMAFIVIGLVTLPPALLVATRSAAWLSRIGSLCAGVALGLYGVLQAVDGVALKHAVDAWVNAPNADKGTRFATAETVRWLEWGTRSYQCHTLGIALVLLGAAVALSNRLPKTLGALMTLSGLAYLVRGWVLGSHGFSDDNTTAMLLSYFLMLAWTAWLTVLAWRARAATDATTSLSSAITLTRIAR